MAKFSWQEYWSDKTNGGHRFQDNTFLKKEAQEKLFHLAGGKSLLDFGCGSADLLIFFIPEYENVIGVDFSLSMLEKAKEKIDNAKFKNANLIHANDSSIWDKIDQSFDRIINVGVIQYLTINQIEGFLDHASEKLNPDGKIIFFDVIDPRIFDLWKAGLFSEKSFFFNVFLRVTIIKFLNLFKKEPKNIMGYTYDPQAIERIAQKYGFQMEYVKSMYYEYRYHAILFKNPNGL